MNWLNRYLEVCRKAVIDPEVFKNFKQYPEYQYMLEHVSYDYGLGYLNVIIKEYPYLLDHIKTFIENDLIGNPTRYNYEKIGYISPTTLRYIKVLGDLNNLFKLDGCDIVEIGVGYGGQCKIIHDIVKVKSYTLIDLPDVLSLADKYLKQYGINAILRTPEDTSEIPYNLCISNYAFTELDENTKKLYTDKILKNSLNGYMTCNGVSQEEIQGLRGGVISEEIPLTGKGNFIYIWTS